MAKKTVEGLGVAGLPPPCGVIDLSDEVDPLEMIRERIRQGARVAITEQVEGLAKVEIGPVPKGEEWEYGEEPS